MLSLQTNDKDLFGRVGYKVVPISPNEASRKLNLIQKYTGPDPITVSLVQSRCESWSAHPRKCWTPQVDWSFPSTGDPQAELIKLFVHAQQDSA